MVCGEALMDVFAERDKQARQRVSVVVLEDVFRLVQHEDGPIMPSIAATTIVTRGTAL